MSLVAPHGGKLINRIVEPGMAQTVSQEAGSLPSLTLSPREQFDLEMISIGAFSPLQGFIGQADFESVCRNMRLANGTVWPIPVVLCPPNDQAAKIQVNQKIALKDSQGRLLAVMNVPEKYRHDKELEIPNVYRTTDDAHPGVAQVRKQGDMCLAGGWM